MGSGASGSVVLFLAGDVMTGRGVDQILPHPSEPHLYEAGARDARDYISLSERVSGPIPRGVDFAYVWGDALDEFSRVSPEARVVNLETSITRNEEPWSWKEVLYRMSPDNVPCLSAAAVDVCVLANNHVLDWGRAGLVETLDVLRGAGIQTAGAGRTPEEAWQPAVQSIPSGGRVVVFGLGHPSSGIPGSWDIRSGQPGVVLVHDLSDETASAVAEHVQRARRPGDVVVASIHWGSNWGYDVPLSHARFAHALIEGGVDVIHGHSSHHLRPIEVHRGKPILYGCGDFLDDYEGISGFERYRDDLVLMYFVDFDATHGELVELRMVPMHIRRMRLERASASDTVWLLETLGRISAPYGTKAVMDQDGSLVVRAAATDRR